MPTFYHVSVGNRSALFVMRIVMSTWHPKMYSLDPERYLNSFKSVIFEYIYGSSSRYFVWTCSEVNAIDTNMGSANDMLSSGMKPLPEPMLTKICRHMTWLGHDIQLVHIALKKEKKDVFFLFTVRWHQQKYKQRSPQPVSIMVSDQ